MIESERRSIRERTGSLLFSLLRRVFMIPNNKEAAAHSARVLSTRLYSVNGVVSGINPRIPRQ